MMERCERVSRYCRLIVNSGGYWFAYIFAYDLIRKDKRKILSFVAVIVAAMQEMLYRGKTVIFQNNCLTFKNEISFDTYFNMFSSCKWNTYTKISTVSFKISLQGRGKIEVVAGNQDNIKECIIKEIKYNSDI